MLESLNLAILRLYMDQYQVRKQRCALLRDHFQAGCIAPVFTHIPSAQYSSQCCFYRGADLVSANTEISLPC